MNIIILIPIGLSIISTLTSIIVAIFTYKNLKELKLARIEESRANILFYIDKHRGSLFHNLIVKNFGKSGGKVINISTSPKIDITKSGITGLDKTITDFKNIYLAPGQFIKSAFDFRNYPDKHFSVTISYESMNKVYTENYEINLDYSDKVLTESPSIRSEIDGLKYINESIKNLSDKLG